MVSHLSAVSAPGKVLLAGGYLVVDRAYKGLVLGLSARIHVLVHGGSGSPGTVTVRSPQFQGAIWQYRCQVEDDRRGVTVSQRDQPGSTPIPRNKFVETALAYAFSYITYCGQGDLPSLEITILADSDYYSHALTSTVCPKHPESRFKNFGVRLHDAHKTGLGSSAALVTALVSAVFMHCTGQLSTSIDVETRRKMHNLAQTAHCVAQGKIGSGFDVAAAVYGSCVYRRFSPAILDSIGAIGSPNWLTHLGKTIDDEDGRIWDTEIDASAINLPKGLRLVMCDVDCGSETPSMVKKVMEWRKTIPEESLVLWETLSRANMELAAELERSARGNGSDYTALRDNIAVVRSLIREMSIKANVPIEPPVQTHLLDTCSALEGVVGGVVPGAGGYDALSIILEDKEDVLTRLQECLKGYESPQHLSEDTQIGNVRLLDVKQEAEGLKIESPKQYLGWVDQISLET